jgi:hypothetical protein
VLLVPVRHEHDLVLGRVEPDVRAADVVEDDEIGPLRDEFLPRALQPAPGARRAPRTASTSVVGVSSTVQEESPFGRFSVSGAAGL